MEPRSLARSTPGPRSTIRQMRNHPAPSPARSRWPSWRASPCSSWSRCSSWPPPATRLQLRWVALLALAGVPAVVAHGHPILGPIGRFAEVVIVGLAASEVAVGGGGGRHGRLRAGRRGRAAVPRRADDRRRAAAAQPRGRAAADRRGRHPGRGRRAHRPPRTGRSSPRSGTSPSARSGWCSRRWAPSPPRRCSGR